MGLSENSVWVESKCGSTYVRRQYHGACPVIVVECGEQKIYITCLATDKEARRGSMIDGNPRWKIIVSRSDFEIQDER